MPKASKCHNSVNFVYFVEFERMNWKMDTFINIILFNLMKLSYCLLILITSLTTPLKLIWRISLHRILGLYPDGSKDIRCSGEQGTGRNLHTCNWSTLSVRIFRKMLANSGYKSIQEFLDLLLWISSKGWNRVAPSTTPNNWKLSPGKLWN